LDAALDADLKKFVFTSTAGALAINDSRVVTEDDPHNWDQGAAYIQARVAAENLVLSYARDKGLPAVAMCISTTYGPRDWAPTPHGSMLSLVANGKFPFYLDYSSEVVGIEDAAKAMLLAAEHGRSGERYIISDRSMSVRELHEIAATAVGRKPPRFGIPMSVLRAGARLNDVLARLLGRDLPFAYAGIRMAELMSPLDHGKAERELGWTPAPVEDSIRKAAVFFASRN
jgi:nucleoside-diphosphate-sugar epimerase